MTIFLHEQDLPDTLAFGASVAIDTETMGLNPHRDRLCLVQLSFGDGDAHLVRIQAGQTQAPNLKRLCEDASILKIFHFARFDVAVLKHALNISCAPVTCTKIASKLCRTFSDKHGLKELCRDLLGLELNKGQQTSDWGSDHLSEEQKAYAASDVLHLHLLKEKLDVMVEREQRTHLLKACCDFLPARAELDLQGWPEIDIFEH
jgi:ribonuclease D